MNSPEVSSRECVSFTRRTSLLLAAILVLAAVLRFTGIGWGLPNEYHRYSYRVDESTYLLQLREMDPRRLDFVSESYPFRIPPVPAYIYGGTLTGAALLGQVPFSISDESFRDHPEYLRRLYLYPRVVSASLGVLSALLVFLLALRLFGREQGLKIGLLAAAFLAVSPVHVEYSHFLLADVMTGFWIILAMLVGWSWIEKPDWKRGVLFGFLAAIALSSKHSSWPLLLLLPTAFIMVVKENGWKAALGKGLLPLFALGAVYLLLNPVLLLSPSTLTADLAFARESTTPSAGRFSLDWSLCSLLAVGFGWPMLLLAVLSLIAALALRGKRALFLLVPLLGWVFMFLFLHLERIQLWSAWAPVLLLFTAWGTIRIYDWIREEMPMRVPFPSRWIRALFSFLVIGTLIFNLWQSGAIASHLSRKSVYEEAREWIETNIRPGARIAVVNWMSIPQIDTTRFETEALGLDFTQDQIVDGEYFLVNEFDEPLVIDRLDKLELVKEWEPKPSFLGIPYRVPYSDMKITMACIRLYGPSFFKAPSILDLEKIEKSKKATKI